MTRPMRSDATRTPSMRHARRCLLLISLVSLVSLGGCAAISRNCPTDPRAEAPWWCAVANVEEDVYARETDRRGDEMAGRQGELDRDGADVDAERERLERAETDNVELAAELDRLRSETRSAERRLESMRASGARSKSVLDSLEVRLDDVTTELEELRSRSAVGTSGTDVARARRAELEAELDDILETLAE